MVRRHIRWVAPLVCGVVGAAFAYAHCQMTSAKSVEEHIKDIGRKLKTARYDALVRLGDLKLKQKV